MLRLNVFCLALASLGQVLPQGCPLAPPETNNPPSSQPRGTIETQAEAAETASAGETVFLRASVAEDAGQVSYSWFQTAGPGVMILDADQAEARFVAPSLPADQQLTFSVTTSNEAGDVGRADVTVRVLADPDYGVEEDTGGAGGPVARAGLDRDITENTAVTLDGSASTGDELTYAWEQTAGRTVTLENADSAQATFTAPAFDPGGDNSLTFLLTVRDRRGRSDTDEVVLRVIEGEGADPHPQVRIETSMGTFVVELDRENAPVTVNNFLQYVDDGFYDGTIFHRVIADFVVQGGGYEPGLVPKETRDPIENESDNGLSNERGTIAMARTSDPDSATSQFYINLVDNLNLDYQPGQPGYAVFGRVIEGMDVVDAIGQVETGSQQGFNDVPLEDVLLIHAERVVPDAGEGKTPDTTPDTSP